MRNEFVLTIIVSYKNLAKTIVKDILHKKLFMYSTSNIDHHHIEVQ